MLYVLVAAPIAAALLTCFGAGRDASAAFRLGLVLSLSVFGLGLPLVLGSGDQSVSVAWFSLWGTGATVHLHLASDGLSAWLIQLVTGLTVVAIIGARNQAGAQMREFVAAALAMEAMMIGALLARDLVVFYLCYEAMLVPMVVLIATLGGSDRRGAALQFFLFTMLGSVFMLVGIWYIAAKTESTDLATVITLLPRVFAQSPVAMRVLFAAFALAFAVKVPLMPLHGWQARAYAEAPAAAVVLLSGAMAKIGAYGFLRFVLPMFPHESARYAGVFIVLGLIGVVAGALIAWAQTDVKRLLAWSSLSHLGLVIVGIFTFQSTALAGATVQMVAHGLSAAALFLLVGCLESRTEHAHRTGRRGIDDYGGLSERMPIFATCFVLAALASAALPGTGNFVGEFLVLYGTFIAPFKSAPWVAALAGLTAILSAVYLLRLVQRWLYGPGRAAHDGIADLRASEALAVVPLIIASFALGLYPRPVSAQAGPAVDALAAAARSAAAGEDGGDQGAKPPAAKGEQPAEEHHASR